MRASVSILIVVSALLGMEGLYRWTQSDTDRLNNAPECFRLSSVNDSAEVVFFGESSNTSFAPNDTTTRSISELCARETAPWNWVSITKYASHAGIYKFWAQQLSPKAKPRCMVITVNLRSFNADWRHSELEPALQQSLVLYKTKSHLLNRFLLSLGFYPHSPKALEQEALLQEWDTTVLPVQPDFKYKTVRAWDNAYANGYYLKPDGSWDMDKIQLACHYIKSYAFYINEQNSRIKDLDALCNWALQRKIPLVFNIMAENLDYADSLVGPELTRLIRQNRDFIVKRYRSLNVHVLDHLESVKGSDFIDQNWTTEHYNQTGRINISKKTSQYLLKQFSKP